MDSRQLYIAAEHLNQVVFWEKEWIHFDTGDQVKYDLIEKIINNFLEDNQLHLIYQRTNSKTTNRDEIMNEIQVLLGQQAFQIWNSSMDKVIKFDKMGVLLLGKRP
jgi:hypothetical protein